MMQSYVLVPACVAKALPVDGRESPLACEQCLCENPLHGNRYRIYLVPLLEATHEFCEFLR